MENVIGSNGLIGVGIGLFLFFLIFFIATIVATVRIIQKAGYSGWWILVSFVPMVNLVFFFVFAFSEWPVEKRTYLSTGGVSSR